MYLAVLEDNMLIIQAPALQLIEMYSPVFRTNQQFQVTISSNNIYSHVLEKNRAVKFAEQNNQSLPRPKARKFFNKKRNRFTRPSPQLALPKTDRNHIIPESWLSRQAIKIMANPKAC